MMTVIFRRTALVWLLPLVLGLFLSGCSKQDPVDVLREAIGLMHQKNYVSARHRLEELLSKQPDNELKPEALTLIADCYSFEKRDADAREVYRQLVQEFPQTLYSWKSNLRLAEFAQQKENWDEAVNYYQAAIADVSEEDYLLTSYQGLAQLYFASDQRSKAIEKLEEMLDISQYPPHRFKIVKQLLRHHLDDGDYEAAWDVYDVVYEDPNTRQMMDDLMKGLLALTTETQEYERGFDYCDAVINDTTNVDMIAHALYFKGLIAASTPAYRSQGVADLQRVNEEFGQTVMGRWAPVDAALIVLDSSTEFEGYKEISNQLFDVALNSYSDLIDNVTIEWFEPRKAAWAWSQIARIYQLRGHALKSKDDLIAASNTLGEIPKRFATSNLPEVVQSAEKQIQQLVFKINLAEASPEEFFAHTRVMRVHDDTPPPVAPSAIDEASAEVSSATP